MSDEIEIVPGITTKAGRMGGFPCIQGRWIPASLVAGRFYAGDSYDWPQTGAVKCEPPSWVCGGPSFICKCPRPERAAEGRRP